MSGGGRCRRGCPAVGPEEGAGRAVAAASPALSKTGADVVATGCIVRAIGSLGWVSGLGGGDETGSGGWPEDTGDEEAEEQADELLPVDELRQVKGAAGGGGGCGGSDRGVLCSITIDLFSVGLILSELLLSGARATDPLLLPGSGALPFGEVAAATADGGDGLAIFLHGNGAAVPAAGRGDVFDGAATVEAAAALAGVGPPTSVSEFFAALSRWTCFSQTGVTTSGSGQVLEGQPAEKCLWQTLM